jgi:LmbE family N-acetylglucosaminyl deacetylase
MFSEVKSVLVLEPHPDDLAIGCGGLTQRLVANGSRVHCLLLSAVPPQYRKIYDESGSYVTYDGAGRMAEADRAAKILGLSGRTIAFGHEWHHKLDALPRSELIGAIERSIRELAPQLVLVPERSFNQDHIAVFEAFQAVMRPHFYRGMVLAYETTMEREFEPNVLIALGPEQVRRKLEACGAYKSQLGTPNHLFSLETMELAMRYRGRLIYADAAEAFRLIRAAYL